MIMKSRMCVKLIDANSTTNIFSLKDIKCANIATLNDRVRDTTNDMELRVFRLIYGIISLKAFGKISILNFLAVSAGSPSMCKGAN